MKKKLLLLIGFGIMLLTACGGTEDSKEKTNTTDAVAIEKLDSSAKAMDDIQAEIEAKRAELEELVKEIEEVEPESE